MENEEQKNDKKKKNVWLPLKINFIIFGIYSIVSLATAGLAKDSSFMLFYAFGIAIQVICCLLAFIVLIFTDAEKAGVFFLSGLLVLVIGFSACSGIASIWHYSF